jgi:hypothetical protein
MVIFHSYVNVYQRVTHQYLQGQQQQRFQHGPFNVLCPLLTHGLGAQSSNSLLMGLPENGLSPKSAGSKIKVSHMSPFLMVCVSMDWFKGKSTGNHGFSH